MVVGSSTEIDFRCLRQHKRYDMAGRFCCFPRTRLDNVADLDSTKEAEEWHSVRSLNLDHRRTVCTIYMSNHPS